MEKKISKSKIIVLMVAICIAILTLSTGVFGFAVSNKRENRHSEANEYIEETIMVDGTEYRRVYMSSTSGSYYQYFREGESILTFNGISTVEISTPEQLKLLAYQHDVVSDLVGTIELQNDLDMSEVENMKSIGSSSYPFKGTFDGQGHTIKNLVSCATFKYIREVNIDKKVYGMYDAYFGLFGMIDGAKIQNVYIDYDSTVSTKFEFLTGRAYLNVFAGILVGCAEGNISISNCYAYIDGSNSGKGIVYNTFDVIRYLRGYISVGGMVGQISLNADQKAEIVNCGINANMDLKYSNFGYGNYFGGLVGTIAGSSKADVIIKNSYYKGDIDITPKNTSAGSVSIGGILGASIGFSGGVVDPYASAPYVKIKSCYSTMGKIELAPGEKRSPGGYTYRIATIGNFGDNNNIVEDCCWYSGGFKYCSGQEIQDGTLHFTTIKFGDIAGKDDNHEYFYWWRNGEISAGHTSEYLVLLKMNTNGAESKNLFLIEQESKF